MSGYNMQDWLNSMGYNTTAKCECGCDTAKLGTYGHAPWCPVYIAPVPVTDHCGCGIGGWHSPLCAKRTWPDEVTDPVKKLQQDLKKAIDLINENK